MLTRWTGTMRATPQRFWLTQTDKTPASTITESQGRYVIVIYSPDGKVLDVGATKTRGAAQTLVTKCLVDFVSFCEVSFLSCSDEFKDWLGI